MTTKLIRFLNSTGDREVPFDTEDQGIAAIDKTAQARADFEQAMAAGSTAFDVSKGQGSNRPAPRVTNFDKLGDETVVIPRVVGG